MFRFFLKLSEKESDGTKLMAWKTEQPRRERALANAVETSAGRMEMTIRTEAAAATEIQSVLKQRRCSQGGINFTGDVTTVERLRGAPNTVVRDSARGVTDAPMLVNG